MLPLLFLTLFLAGCFPKHDNRIEVQTTREASSSSSTISAIVVENSLPDPLVLPDASGPEPEFQSATFEKTKLRGKQGLVIGMTPGTSLYGGRNAKGDLLSMTLGLAGALAGGITGSAIGFVEGGTEDLIAIAGRIQDDKYTKEDVQEVYGALNTRKLLTENLQEMSSRKPEYSIVVVSESDSADLPEQARTAGSQLHVKVIQIDFPSRHLGAEPSHEFVLVVSTESDLGAAPSFPLKRFTYRSTPRLLSEWASGGPKLLRHEHSLACKEIAESIFGHYWGIDETSEKDKQTF